MSASDVKLPFRKLKFEWKKAINNDPLLGGAAKRLASHLCDQYVNNENGCVWPKEQRLADDLGRSVRTVQRHYKELEEAGYLKRTKVRRARKAFKIALPKRPEHDTEHDSLTDANTSKLSNEHDKTVVPYKNTGSNQEMCETKQEPVSFVRIAKEEVLSLEEWSSWIKTHTSYDTDELFQLFENTGCYHLPSRFPVNENAEKYQKYFRLVVESNGEICK